MYEMPFGDARSGLGFVGSCRRDSSPPLSLPPSNLPPSHSPPTFSISAQPRIRWQRAELIGSGSFGRVYLGLNLE